MIDYMEKGGLTAAIFAWRPGGIGVDARGLRLVKSPVTERLGAEAGTGVRED